MIPFYSKLPLKIWACALRKLFFVFYFVYINICNIQTWKDTEHNCAVLIAVCLFSR